MLQITLTFISVHPDIHVRLLVDLINIFEVFAIATRFVLTLGDARLHALCVLAF